jgi:ribosomal protein L17
MDKSAVAFWLTLVGTICWGICFWWMHRISAKQNYLLDQLREQAKRIESLSQIEHDLIKEVHPQVGEIKETVEEMVAVSKEKNESNQAEQTRTP